MWSTHLGSSAVQRWHVLSCNDTLHTHTVTVYHTALRKPRCKELKSVFYGKGKLEPEHGPEWLLSLPSSVFVVWKIYYFSLFEDKLVLLTAMKMCWFDGRSPAELDTRLLRLDEIQIIYPLGNWVIARTQECIVGQTITWLNRLNK